jgi:hypothetical protein
MIPTPNRREFIQAAGAGAAMLVLPTTALLPSPLDRAILATWVPISHGSLLQWEGGAA